MRAQDAHRKQAENQAVNRPEHPPIPHRLHAAASIATLALLLGACAAPADRGDEVDVRPRTVLRQDGPPAQCVPEGQSCQAAQAVCCPGTTCAGVGRGVCISAY